MLKALLPVCFLAVVSGVPATSRSIVELLPPSTFAVVALEDARALLAACESLRAVEIGELEEFAEFRELIRGSLERLLANEGLAPLVSVPWTRCRRGFVALLAAPDKTSVDVLVGAEIDAEPGEWPPSTERLFTARDGDLCLAATRPEPIDELLARRRDPSGAPSLATSAAFRRVSGRIDRSPDRLFAYFDFAVVARWFDVDLPGSEADASGAIAPRVAATWRVVDGRMRTDGFVETSETFAACFPSTPLDLELLAWIPEDVTSFELTDVSWASVAERVAAYWPEWDAGAWRDRLRGIGPKVLVMAPKPANPLVSTLVVAVEADDPDAVIAWLAKEAEDNSEFAMEPVEVAGGTIHRIVTTEPLPFTPALTVHDGWVFVALAVSDLRRLERVWSGDAPSILDRPAFADAWVRIVGEPDQARVAGVSFTDVPAMLEAIWPRLGLLGVYADAIVFPFDPAALPLVEDVIAPLEPTLAVSWPADGGWRFRREGSPGGELTSLGGVTPMLGVLGAIVVKNVLPIVRKGRVNAARASINQLKAATTHYGINNGRPPASLDVLCEPDPNNLDEPYIDQRDSLIDPWGTPYDLKVEGRRFVIVCYGADGRPGGEGDDADIRSDKR